MSMLATASSRRSSRQRLFWWILPLALIGGWRYPVLGYLLPLCMVAAMGIAVFRGRYWCDWLCPRGSSWDLVLGRISVKKKIPLFFRSTMTRIAMMMILMGAMAILLPRAWPSVEGMGHVFVVMLSVTTGLGVVLGAATHPRSWCAFCPVGTMANWLGRGKYPLTVSAACNKCKKCDAVCPIQIQRWPYRPESDVPAIVPEWDCLKCGLCIEARPTKALTLESGRMRSGKHL